MELLGVCQVMRTYRWQVRLCACLLTLAYGKSSRDRRVDCETSLGEAGGGREGQDKGAGAQAAGKGSLADQPLYVNI